MLAVTSNHLRTVPLTKKSQVSDVLHAGGRIVAGHRPGLLQLLDAEGRPVHAWQTALKAAQLSAAPSGDPHEPQ